MSSSEDLQYPRQLLEYRDGFLVSKAMFTACELGIFDLLQECGGPLSSTAIAERLHASVDGMERLLCACVGLKLLEFEMKKSEAFYKNTDLSAIYLTKSSPKSLLPMMIYYSHTVYKYSNNLTEAVREGTHQHQRVSGISSKVFEAVYRSDDEMITFMEFMNSFSMLFDRDVLTAFDLSPFDKVCDLGGCSGALAKLWASMYPNSTITVFDLPEVINAAKKQLIPAEDNRILFHEGDFFEDPFPEADLYIFGRVFHDWNDDKCLQLLSKVYNSCKPGGGVMLIESFLNEDKMGPLPTQLFSLKMLLMTEGKERTTSEYKTLLMAAGFRDIEARNTGKFYAAILGLK
ncbi:acetylserotonin O-methyltransferase-like [Lissotriton helveticus]